MYVLVLCYSFAVIRLRSVIGLFFFFNDTATTEIYTLSLHDALPISCSASTPRTGRHASIRSKRCAPNSMALHSIREGWLIAVDQLRANKIGRASCRERV